MSDTTSNLNTLGKASSRFGDSTPARDNTAGATAFENDADAGGVWVSESSYSQTTKVPGEAPHTVGAKSHEEGVIDPVGVING